MFVKTLIEHEWVNDALKRDQKCPYFPHLGPVGFLPAPNIFHLANEFAKGKMYWNSLKCAKI